MVPQVVLSEQGPRMSRMVQGFWRLAGWDRDARQIASLVDGCLEQGITAFDHADIYGSYTCEGLFGAAWADMRVDRAQIQLVTKCGIKLVSKNRPQHRVHS